MNPAQILCERVLCDMMAEAHPPDLDGPADRGLGFLQCFETRITRACYSDLGNDPEPDCMEDYTGTLADALQRCARHHYGRSVDLQGAIDYVQDWRGR